MYDALDSIFENNKHLKRRIFLLTDGDIENPDETTDLIKKNCDGDSCRLFAFGIGNDCDKPLVKKAAKEGKGV